MKLDRAIKVLKNDLRDNAYEPSCDLECAIKLGIEALKDFKRYRGRVASGHYRTLPGETKE